MDVQNGTFKVSVTVLRSSLVQGVFFFPPKKRCLLLCYGAVSSDSCNSTDPSATSLLPQPAVAINTEHCLNISLVFVERIYFGKPFQFGKS